MHTVQDTLVNNVRIGFSSDIPLAAGGTLHPDLGAVVTDVAHSHPEPNVLFPCGIPKHCGSGYDVTRDGLGESGRRA